MPLVNVIDGQVMGPANSGAPGSPMWQNEDGTFWQYNTELSSNDPANIRPDLRPGSKEQVQTQQQQAQQKAAQLAKEKSLFTRENGFYALTPAQMQQINAAPTAHEKTVLSDQFQQQAGWGYETTPGTPWFDPAAMGARLSENYAYGERRPEAYQIFDESIPGTPGFYRTLSQDDVDAYKTKNGMQDTPAQTNWSRRGGATDAEGNMYFSAQAAPRRDEWTSDLDEFMGNASKGGVGMGLLIGGGAALGLGGGAAAGGGAGAGTGIDASTGLFAGETASSGAAGASGATTGGTTSGLGASTLSSSAGSESLLGSGGGDTVATDDYGYDPGGEGTYNTPTTSDTTLFPNGMEPSWWQQAKSLLQQGKSYLDIAKMLGLTEGEMKGLGTLASTGLGVLGSQRQTDEFRRLADQYASYGAPYRERLSNLYADPTSFLKSPEVSIPVQQASDIAARSLSMGGNPIGSGNALQKLQSYSSDQLFGRLGQEKDRLAGFGGLTQYNAAAPGAATNAINSEANIFNAVGSGISNIFNPPQTLAQQMAEFQRLSKMVQ